MGVPDHAAGGGRQSAEAFYRAHRDDLGQRSTLDLDELTQAVSGMTSGRIHQGAQVLIANHSRVAALSVASSVFAPVAFALFIIALVWPLQRSLQGFLPRMLALAISIVVMVLAFFAFGSLIVWAFGRVGRWIAADAVRFQQFYDQPRSGSKAMASP